MQCVLSGGQIRTLSSAVHCLARSTHAAEVTLRAYPSKLILSTLNASKTSFISITFKSTFFDSYLLSVPSATCCVLVKAMLTVFRTQPGNMETLSMSLESASAPKMKWTIWCPTGIRKTYWLTCIHSGNEFSSLVDPATFPSNLVVKPKEFNRLLGHFQSALGEITLIATEPLTTPVTDDSAPPEAKAVELKSYVDAAKRASDGPGLHTQLWIDPSEEFHQYCHSGAAVDVTFSLKELRAFIAFCESVEVDVQMFFEKAGNPVIFTPNFGMSESVRGDFDAMLVLATMVESELRVPRNSEGQGRSASHQNEETGIPSSARAQSKDADLSSPAANNAQNSEATRKNTIGSLGSSDQTNIWSDLSGSGGHQSEFVAYPTSEGARTGHDRHQATMEDSMDASEEIQRGRLHARPNSSNDETPPPRTRKEGSRSFFPMDPMDEDSPSGSVSGRNRNPMERTGYGQKDPSTGSQRRAQMSPIRENEGEDVPMPAENPSWNPNTWIGNSMDEDDDEDDEEYVMATPPEKRARPF